MEIIKILLDAIELVALIAMIVLLNKDEKIKNNSEASFMTRKEVRDTYNECSERDKAFLKAILLLSTLQRKLTKRNRKTNEIIISSLHFPEEIMQRKY